MSNSILVAYASRFGSTAEVAQSITETLNSAGFHADCLPMADVQALDDYDAFVLGSAVNYGKWLPEGVDFVRNNQMVLIQKPTALFTVHIQNLENNAMSRRNRLAYLDEIRPLLKPVAEGFFAGRFNRQGAYLLIPRWLARLVPTFEKRDWPAIRRWAGTLPPFLFRHPHYEHLTH
jgi:menaquinone-dependent protoporphyrinogen oxidase